MSQEELAERALIGCPRSGLSGFMAPGASYRYWGF
jgi:hypothetical protein